MKKISLFLSMALTIFATTFVSCGDEQVTPDGPDNPENANWDVYSFNETLNYNSTKASSNSAFSASSRQAVPATSASADFCVGTQGQYGTFVCSPNASLLAQCYDANGITYSSNKSTKIQNLGSVDIKDYNDASTFDKMSISADYLDGKSSLGVGVNQLSSGQAIAFETSDGCKGVAKMSFSKVTKAVTISGYVAVPKNASH
ncbi:MAG: hypothetical protein IKS00_04260 [Bacteroidales bacterium]|nr:hypothetical protein [Bacteroidales bacterium]